MWFFEKGLKASVMSTELIIEANVTKKVLFQALSYAKKFEQTYSAYRDDSLLNRINDNAGISPVSCTKEELEIFELALYIANQSEGVFDPTIGSLTQGLYGFGKKNVRVPSTSEIQQIKELINYKNISLSSSSVFLKKKGMRLDLGGIGKGYVADKIIAILQENGATKGFVSVGGEICSFGKKFTFAIKDPFDNSQIIALIKSSKNALCMATSGDYERFVSSKQHHHILNATTATQNHYYTSITLLKDGIDATMLDALSTLIFNTPVEKLQEVAKQYNLTVIAITHKEEIIFANYTLDNLRSIEFFPRKNS